MLQFNKEVDYALQLLLALKRLKGNELLSLRNFSKDSDISFLFLQRIAFKLKNAGVVKSVKGAQGGYCLAVKAKQLTLKVVITALEGDCVVASCLRTGCQCEKEKNCQVHPIFCEINKKFIDYLSDVNLEDVAKYGK